MATKGDSGRNAQLVRVLSILRDLDRLGGLDMYELAQRYGTSVRTIRRDLEALEAVGFPLEGETHGKKKLWRLPVSKRIKRLTRLLDASHYLGLKLVMGQVGGAARATGLFTALEDLSDKIEDALGPRAREILADIEGSFHSYEKRTFSSAPPDAFWPLVVAFSEHRLCNVTYRAPRAEPREKTYRVLPLRLFTYQGAIYLMSYMPKYKNYLNLNLHRLRALRVLRERHDVPADFDPNKLENAAFGVYHNGRPVTYRLRFQDYVAEYIRERIWHPTQKLIEQKDGRLELTFRCVPSYEVTAWVASWMEGVEVVAPRSLRAELRQLGQHLTDTYA